MALYVNSNVSSLNAQRRLTNNTNSLDSTYQKLASGFRINAAKDDASGLQISNRLTSQIYGLDQGNRNANDGIALAQTAESAMEEMTNMLQRIRTIALQSANGTNTAIDRKALQTEVSALSSEITRISQKTTYNGEPILAGRNSGSTLLDSEGNLKFQVGAYAYDSLSVNLADGFSITQMAQTALEKQWGGSIGLEIIDDSLPQYQGISVDELLASNKIPQQLAKSIIKGSSDNGTAAPSKDSALLKSPNGDVNIAADVASTEADYNIGNKVYINSSNIYEIMLSASETDTTVYSSLPTPQPEKDQVAVSARTLISSLFGLEIHPNPDHLTINTDLTYTNPSTPVLDSNINFDVSSQAKAQATLNWVDSFIMIIDGKRADLGATQNKMQSTIKNQSNISQNTTDARSRIKDTDFALETANLTALSILQQSSQSVLTQANQRPQIALSLIGTR